MLHASCVWHCGHNCIRLMVHTVIMEHVGILGYRAVFADSNTWKCCTCTCGSVLTIDQP